MADPKKPKDLPSANVSADGPIPAENWDNDQRCRDDSMIDTSPGSVYDHLTQRDKDIHKPKK
jgi:hypothetical protein